MHSKHFKTVKSYYNTFRNGERVWDINRVRNAVEKGWITEEEFTEITGEAY